MYTDDAPKTTRKRKLEREELAEGLTGDGKQPRQLTMLQAFRTGLLGRAWLCCLASQGAAGLRCQAARRRWRRRQLRRRREKEEKNIIYYTRDFPN